MPARVLAAWLAAGHTIAGVWTSSGISRATWRKDRHLGWFAPQWSLSTLIARAHLPHRTIERMADPATGDALAAVDADVILSVFFPYILPRGLIERLTVPIFNLHPALLPAYRGPAPLVSMLRDETAATHGGVTLHRLTPTIDAGPICAAIAVPLPPDRNPRRWEIDLARAAAHLVVDAVPKAVAGALDEIAQDESSASYMRADPADWVVTAATTAARLDWLIATVGWFAPISVAIGDHRYDVSRVGRRVGPAAGAPPRIGLATIAMDLADGRYRLWRRPIWQGRKLRWKTFLLRVRARG